MKKIRFLAAVIAAVLLTCSMAAASAQRTVVTSFYPMYVFALNVTKGVDGVRVVNMADQSAGCLHDYQLQTRDMVTLDGADVLIVNGGGMEQFVGKISSVYPQLPVITAGEGIDMLESMHGAHTHDHEHGHGDECVLNAHVWLDPMLAAQQVMNIASGLAGVDPDNAQAYMDNASAYCAKLTEMNEAIAAQLAPFAGEKIIAFHEAFVYFAGAYGLEVAALIENDDGEEPGTRDLAKICDLVRSTGIRALFVEPQYPQKAAATIARETGAGLYQLDPVVSGDGLADSYERAMYANAKIFTEALTK